MLYKKNESRVPKVGAAFVFNAKFRGIADRYKKVNSPIRRIREHL